MKKIHLRRRRVIAYVAAGVVTVLLLVVGWQLFVFSSHVRSVNAARTANTTQIMSAKESLKQQQAHVSLEALDALSEKLVNPSAACLQRTSYLGVRIGAFSSFVKDCNAYSARVVAVSESAKRTYRTAVYAQQLVQALEPQRALGAQTTDPKTVADAYARTAENVRILNVDDTKKETLKDLQALFRLASTQTLAIKEAQDIQSIERFNQKVADLEATAAAIQRYGEQLQTDLSAAGEALQARIAEL